MVPLNHSDQVDR